MASGYVSYVGPGVFLGLLALRMVRNMRGRPLKPNKLWIRPVFLVVILALAMLHPPALTSLNLAIFAACAVVGAGLGYVLASHQTLSIDTATGTITSKTSVVGMALFLGLLALRYAARQTFGGDPMGPHSDSVLLYTDAGLIFVVAMVAAQAWETWRRAMALLQGQGGNSVPAQAGNQAE
ncbi:hypothetical protein FHS83_003654 [Rhizomicrobium palustre]|uniref:DUF1453 domain-containing protein n=1 Tax=Rhizomicrobium palustre TaxID=189966 RepID=A0A846N3M7_9PROT|nr:CcdC protein domain-containing protein [Rhizomicrobium palustre]NIK90336.1 hypothetical protein [Rhizomicrobium palustre]